MICFICNKGETAQGTTSVLLEREDISLTIHNVPVLVCQICNEAYADEGVTASLLNEAEKMANDGIKVVSHDFALADKYPQPYS